ncbi:MAG TPA: tyrosine-protein phosphatase [Asanoa sp.]
MRNRSYAFSGTFNFRDVGGYAGRGDRTVRWGRLYRSDSLHRIDQEEFGALGVRTVVDLRRPGEVERDGRVPEYDGLAYRHIHPEHDEWEPYDGPETLEQYLADRYADLAETGVEGIGTALRVIADPEAAPVVVHCVAGKDRTGIICGLTLSLLGVSDADVAADYALSTQASQRFHAWVRETVPDEADIPPPYLASPVATMELFLLDVRQRYGSVEGYARHAGVAPDEIASMRGHLLE